MAELVPYRYGCQDLETEGRQIYQENDFYRTLGNVMEHPEFRKLFGEYVADPVDLRAVMMYMKIYLDVESGDPSLTGYQKLSLVKKAIGDTDTRGAYVNLLTPSSFLSVKCKDGE